MVNLVNRDSECVHKLYNCIKFELIKFRFINKQLK